MCSFPDLSHPLAAADDEPALKRLVIDFVKDHLRVNPRANFADLLKCLPGVYPTTVLTAMNLARDRPCSARELIKAESGERRRSLSGVATKTDEVLPHPLDSEWRFTPRTVSALLCRMSSCSSTSSLWIGLGTPSILKGKDEAGLARRMILLDTNSALVHLFPQHVATGDALLCDLVVDPIPRVTGDVIVADPPWYYEDMAAFLWVAQQVCCVGGRVLLSTPKIGTRPRIGRELQKLAKWIRCLGFVSETFERDAIEYQSPFFERTALRAEGLSAYPENWRTADLLVLRLEKKTRIVRPRPSEFRKHWQEAAFGTMRLRVLENKRDGFCDPSLRSLSVGDHPVSVSRRDPRKEKAKIWTSGNRVFDCAGAKLFLAIARALETDQRPAAAVEALIGRPLMPKELTRVDIAVRQLQQLAASENAEFRADQIRTPQDSVPHDAASSHCDKLDVRDLSMPWRFGAPADVGIHVAVFVEPFLGFVLKGKKTVESRFSLTRRAPFKQVDVGDLVLLKKSGGPIVGSCRVAQTWFYVIDPASWTQIRREFAQAICAQDSTFWIERAHAKYATLLRIDDVRAFPPVKFAKKDRRGWVVIRRSEEKTAFNLL